MLKYVIFALEKAHNFLYRRFLTLIRARTCLKIIFYSILNFSPDPRWFFIKNFLMCYFLNIDIDSKARTEYSRLAIRILSYI